MKHLKTTLFSLAVCSAAYLTWQGVSHRAGEGGFLSSDPVSPAGHVATHEPPLEAALSAVEPSDGSGSQAPEVCGECGQIHPGHVCAMYGGGPILVLTNIPPGELRSALDVLPVEKQQYALLQLSRLQFRPGDEASLRVDGNGAVFFVCTFTDGGCGCIAHAEQHSAEPESQATPEDEFQVSSEPQATLLGVDTPPIYHSRPGSTNVIFLDFNGADISGTAWNTYKGVSVWRCTAFDADGDATTFNETEQRYIREVWERVSEDYAVFNVDVTTEQPAVWTSNTAHALITPVIDADGVSCPHDGYGGIAYTAVFGRTDYSYNAAGCYSPAWVRPMASSSYASTAEAVSHEVGHNMGLSHDGVAIAEYYTGHTNGCIPWAPIMGTAYTKNLSQWSKGEYYSATRTQDDLAIIASKLVYLPDDYSNTLAQAASVSVSGGMFSASGIVEQSGDSDCFALTCGSGDIELTASTYRCAEGTWGGNGDLIFYLYDQGGVLLASNNPLLETTASITQSVTVGTYYIKISPSAAGSPFSNPPSGYTVYGSIGPYSISGIVPVTGSNLLVRTPNGGEILSRGSSVPIKWSFGLTNHVVIELYDGGQFDSFITTNTLNSGNYSWVVPTNQSVRSSYRIKIYPVDNTNLYDWSDNDFSIGTSILFENFDASGSTPSGWSQQIVSEANLWQFKTGGQIDGISPEFAFSGSNNACLYDSSSADGKTLLITPPLDFESSTNGHLTFQLYMASWGGDQDQLIVYCRTNALSGWVQVARYTNEISSWSLQNIALTNVSQTVQIGFEGNAKYGYGLCLDDVQVIRSVVNPVGEPDVDSDGLPDSWEQLYFGGTTNVSSETISSNGVNTVLEAYIAGLDPTDIQAVFKISEFKIQEPVRVIEWTAVSGRVYSISWSSNLLSGFSFLTNVVWPQSSYTTQVGQSSGFYKLDVQYP